MLDYVDYDRSSGRFRWKHTNNQHAAGDLTGGATHPEGYRQFSTQGLYVLEHRLALFAAHGVWPTGLDVDHVNGDRADNRPDNIRPATRSQNNQNKRRLGVYRHRSSWLASVSDGGKTFRVPANVCFGRALRTYQALRREHHPFSPEARA